MARRHARLAQGRDDRVDGVARRRAGAENRRPRHGDGMSALGDWLEYPFLVRGFLSVLLLAPLLGGMSHLVVARRLSFFSAALGQAALTGLTIGLVLLGEPLNAAYGGIFGFCFLSALAMVYVRRHASLPSDTLVGVFLAMTLGL